MNHGLNYDPVPNSADIPPLNFMNMQQQIAPLDMGYLDNLNPNEQVLQSDIDTW